MAKYHINEHGEPARCHAEIQCRLGGGGTPHFEGTLREAVDWAEQENEKEFGNGGNFSNTSHNKEEPAPVDYSYRDTQFKDNKIGVDPAGCGCTDCIIGNSIPEDNLNAYADELYKDVGLNGRKISDRSGGDNKSNELLFDTTTDKEGKVTVHSVIRKDVLKQDAKYAVKDLYEGASFTVASNQVTPNDHMDRESAPRNTKYYFNENGDIENLDNDWEVVAKVPAETDLDYRGKMVRNPSEITDETSDYIASNPGTYSLVELEYDGENPEVEPDSEWAVLKKKERD